MSLTLSSIDNEINAKLVPGSGITASTLQQVLHDMNAACFQSNVTGFANPSASVGVAANNGVALTAMRSDASPALNTNTSPSWTALHNFMSGLTAGSAGGISGFLTLNGATSGFSTITISSIGTTFQVLGSLSVGTVGAPVHVGQRVTGTVSGTVTTSDYAISIVAGATITGVTTYTTTAFATGTLNFTAGTGVGDNAYIAATNIKALGVTKMTFASSGPAVTNLSSMPAGQPNFFIRLTQTGGPSVVGLVLIIVDYMILPS